MFINILSTIISKINFHYGQLFKAEVWNIGIIEQPIRSILKGPIDSSEINWMPAPKAGTYLADPFAIVIGDTVRVYFEHYNYANRKGQICSVDYQNGKWQNNMTTILTEDHHVSYPFLVEHNEAFYCIPETAQNNQIDLFLLDGENNKLNHEKTLISNINARDASLFQHNGYWWIFCTLEKGPNSMLHIFHSPDLLGPYTAHQNNPVKDDIQSARSAGTPFVVDGQLYRPAQDCSESYGHQLSINKVIKLSPEEFEEIVEKTIEPLKNSQFNLGIHTISSAGGYTLVDGKRTVFIWSNFTFQLNRKIKKVLGAS